MSIPDNIGNSSPLHFKRSHNAIWRFNDDGSILILDELSGEAFILCENMAKVWVYLGEAESNGDAESNDLFKGCKPSDSLGKSITYLLSKGLIEINSEINITSKPSQIVFSHGSEGLIPSATFLVSPIEFGACDCANGGRGWHRNLYCLQADVTKQNTSVVIA